MCDCGTPVFVLWKALNEGARIKCGHGCSPKRKTERLYRIWSNMKSRCSNQNNAAYQDYGGRGIRVCAAWHQYKEFERWAKASGYADDLTIERKDVHGGYYPDNCEWLPKSEQSRNRRSSRWYELGGERKILTDWAADVRCAVGYHTLYNRLSTGWPFEAALTYPRNSRKPKASEQ